MNGQLPPPKGGKGPRVNTDLIREVQSRHGHANNERDAQAEQGQYHYHQYNTYSTQVSPDPVKKENPIKYVIAVIGILVGFLIFLALIFPSTNDNADVSTDASSNSNADADAAVTDAEKAAEEAAQAAALASVEADAVEDLGPSDSELDARFEQFQRQAIVNKYQQATDDGATFFYAMSNQTQQGMCGGDKLMTIGTKEGAVPFEANGTHLFTLQLYDGVGSTTGKMIVGRYRLNKPTLKLQGMQEGTFDDEVGTDLRPADDVGWKNLPLQLVTNDGIPNYTQFKVNGVNYKLCLMQDSPKNQSSENRI